MAEVGGAAFEASAPCILLLTCCDFMSYATYPDYQAIVYMPGCDFRRTI
jgi:hypothetical protein